MTKADLIALAERVERAEGPDRELDAEIAPLKGLRRVDEGQPLGRVWYDHRGHGVPLPAFTASLDAAMTLVPEGWSMRFAWCPKAHYPARWSLYPPGTVPAFDEDMLISAVGYTSPNTLTAASLRAIAEEMDG